MDTEIESNGAFPDIAFGDPIPNFVVPFGQPDITLLSIQDNLNAVIRGLWSLRMELGSILSAQTTLDATTALVARVIGDIEFYREVEDIAIDLGED